MENHSVMHFPFISKVIRHWSVISPSILGVPSTFHTLIGFVFCFHHLCDIPLSINNPSAPQSISVTGVTRYGDTRGYQGWYSLLGYCGTRFRAVLRSRHSRYTESNCIGRVYE